MKTFNEEQVRAALLSRKGSKTFRAFARELGVSQTYIHQVLSGVNKPSPKILKVLGLGRDRQMVVTYYELAAEGKGRK